MPVPERMFGDVVDPSVKLGNKQGRSVFGTVAIYVLLVFTGLFVQLTATNELPEVKRFIDPYITVVMPTPPPIQIAPRKETPKVDIDPSVPPTKTPTDITPEPPVQRDFDKKTTEFIPPGTISGSPSGVPEAPPPPPPAPPAKVEPVIVGGNIKAPLRTRNVAPVYPSIAQSARVQGVVIIQATIGTDGRVQDARILRSIPLLDQAALDAVMQWEFTPTLLNNKPVPVIMTVTVQFALN